MPKAIEKVPETLAELKATLPELTALAIEEGRASVDVKGAVKAEQDRIVAIVVALTGEDAGNKLSAAITSNSTADNLKALGVTLIADGDTALKAEIEQLKAANLELIKAAGADNPGAGDGKKPDTGKDYMTLVDEYMAAKNCSKTTAMQAITGQYPDKHREYIKKANETRRTA